MVQSRWSQPVGNKNSLTWKTGKNIKKQLNKKAYLSFEIVWKSEW